jgi:hypothetical protein
MALYLSFLDSVVCTPVVLFKIARQAQRLNVADVVAAAFA